MSEPTTPTGKSIVGGYLSPPQRVDLRPEIVAIEREAREPTDDGAWFTTDSLAAALHEAGVRCSPNIPYCKASHRGHAQRIIQAAKEGEREG